MRGSGLSRSVILDAPHNKCASGRPCGTHDTACAELHTRTHKRHLARKRASCAKGRAGGPRAETHWCTRAAKRQPNPEGWGSPTERTRETAARAHACEMRIDKSHRLYPMSRQRRPRAVAAASCPVWGEHTERSPRQRLSSPSLVSPPPRNLRLDMQGPEAPSGMQKVLPRWFAALVSEHGESRRIGATLSEASCRNDLPSVHVPTAQARMRRSMCGAREELVAVRTALINSVRG